MVLTALTRPCLRLLKLPNPILASSRWCSSIPQPKSNLDFPNFTTNGKHSKDFSKFIKSPKLPIAATVIIFGATNPGRIPEFDMQAQELIDGSLLAINAVTQIIAHEPNIENSELSDFLTADCFEKVKSLMTENDKVIQHRGLIDTPKEDVMLAWLEESSTRDESKKAKIVTVSFPLFSWLREKHIQNKELLAEQKKQFQEDIQSGKIDFSKGAPKDFAKDFAKPPEGYVQISDFNQNNVIIVSNWDLVQVKVCIN